MNTKLLVNDQILLDTQSGELKSVNLNKVIRLEPMLLELLLVLTRQPNRVVSRKQIIEAVWEGDQRVGNPALTKAISKLRQLFIQYFNAPDLIETLPKKGYRFTANVQPEIPASHSIMESKFIPARNKIISNMILGALLLFIFLIALKFMLAASFHHIIH